MKKVLLILSLVGANVSLASDVFIIGPGGAATVESYVGGKLVEFDELESYVEAVSHLPLVINRTGLIEDLTPHAVRRAGGYGGKLSELLTGRANLNRLRGNNRIRVRSRKELSEILRPIYSGLMYHNGLQNVAVVEYLLNTLVNNHTYSYPAMKKMEFPDKQATLRGTIKEYIKALNDLEK